MPTLQSTHDAPACVGAFPTALGWVSLRWVDTDAAGPALTDLRFGYRDADAALRALPRVTPLATDQPGDPPDAWRTALEAFARGEPTDLRAIPLAELPATPFVRAVLRLCHAIPWGETRTYGKLAELAGHPGAARAVGAVMAGNRRALVVPCHRVAPAGGRLGGFSAPGGVETKRRLLEAEGCVLAR